MPTRMRQLLSGRVYEYLVGQLRARRVPVGTRINVLQIARELGVSRTTVNKAINRLIDAGWVSTDGDRQPVVVAHPSKNGALEHASFEFSNRTDTTFKMILERILRGDYGEGEVIKELPLGKELGVSPATVRRAAEWLCSAGLLERLPRRGWQVVKLEAHDLESIYRIRLLLEPLAVKRAVGRISEVVLDGLLKEHGRLIASGVKDATSGHQQFVLLDYSFHRAILDASGDRILAETLDPLIRKSMLITTFAFRPTRAVQSLKEHKAVLEALRRRDEQEACERLQAHLRSALQWNVEVWKPT